MKVKTNLYNIKKETLINICDLNSHTFYHKLKVRTTMYSSSNVLTVPRERTAHSADSKSRTTIIPSYKNPEKWL